MTEIPDDDTAEPVVAAPLPLPIAPQLPPPLPPPPAKPAEKAPPTKAAIPARDEPNAKPTRTREKGAWHRGFTANFPAWVLFVLMLIGAFTVLGWIFLLARWVFRLVA